MKNLGAMLLAVALGWANPARGGEAPSDFPRFSVPGREAEMGLLRALFHLHYQPARPLATLWDGWIPKASLWPDTERAADLRRAWRAALLGRRIGPAGYVSTHQHRGLAHNDGWPFPLWTQSGGRGWHFSLAGQPYGEQFNVHRTNSIDGWELRGARDRGIDPQRGWKIELTAPRAALAAPPMEVEARVAPFVRLLWQTDTAAPLDQPYLEWTTDEHPDFGPARRMYFSPIAPQDGMTYTHVSCYKHPRWRGTITRLRINFGNREAGRKLTLKSLITAVDSRHNVNNARFLQGSIDYFHWTGDLAFLRANIERMRLALRYALDEFGVRRHKHVVMKWVGHGGRSGLGRGPDGEKIFHFGRGVGNNYWDLLPFGGHDCLATIYYYDAIRRMAELERRVAAHPEWNVPGGPLKFDPADLARLADAIKREAGELFWNDKMGRFVAAIDLDGVPHDYGYTFVNCEAIYYGFADEGQAQSILAWLSGERIVAGDTSQGADIYHWRFAPRASTRRNLDYYVWPWANPESIPWGGQVQDGGAVLSFAYHDLMARLKTNGPDDAWRRLREILDWFGEVQTAGGYRAYYSTPERGTLQGGGTAGGLGLDHEFYESILVPQVMLYGFLGFRPDADGFALRPRLPSDWPRLTIDRVRFHDLRLTLTAARDTISIVGQGTARPGLGAALPPGKWRIETLDADGQPLLPPRTVEIATSADRVPLPPAAVWKLRATRRP